MVTRPRRRGSRSSRLRRETDRVRENALLSLRQLWTLTEARVVSEDFRHDYNTEPGIATHTIIHHINPRLRLTSNVEPFRRPSHSHR